MTSTWVDESYLTPTVSTAYIPKQYQAQDETVSASVPAPEPTASATSSVDSRKVRAWAIGQGIPVGKRGRIKPDVIARYNEAHGA
jgi:hypothetical protein